MKVRRLVPADGHAFQELRLAALQATPEAFASSFDEEKNTPLSIIAGRLGPSDTSAVFAAEAEARLVGLIGIYRENAIKARHKANIWGMFVHLEHRKRGIGTALVREALAFARTLPGLRQVRLSVNASNLPALALYQAHGFHSYGTEPKSLVVNGAVHDEIHMVLFLGRET